MKKYKTFLVGIWFKHHLLFGERGRMLENTTYYKESEWKPSNMENEKIRLAILSKWRLATQASTPRCSGGCILTYYPQRWKNLSNQNLVFPCITHICLRFYTLNNHLSWSGGNLNIYNTWDCWWKDSGIAILLQIPRRKRATVFFLPHFQDSFKN